MDYSETIFYGIPSFEKQKISLSPLQKFEDSDKAESQNFLTSFSNTKYGNSASVRNYIFKLV